MYMYAAFAVSVGARSQRPASSRPYERPFCALVLKLTVAGQLASMGPQMAITCGGAAAAFGTRYEAIRFLMS